MTRLARLAPALVIALCGAWLVSKAVPPRDADGGFKIQAFAHLPVVYQGRVKPYDTLARNNLVIISDRQTWRDEDGNKRPAIEWLLDVMSGSPRAAEHKVFRIHNLQLLAQSLARDLSPSGRILSARQLRLRSHEHSHLMRLDTLADVLLDPVGDYLALAIR